MQTRLTPKEARFVQQYLLHLNATDAYQAAGFKATGHSARVQASKLLQKPRVAAAIAAGQAVVAAKAGLTAEIVREQNAFIATFDPSGLFNENGQLRHVKDMPRHIRCALKSVEVVKRNLTSGDGVTDTTYKVQFWDKPKALEMEYKHFGLLTDSVEHKGEIRIKWQE
jgi:phage terminase small subunit